MSRQELDQRRIAELEADLKIALASRPEVVAIARVLRDRIQEMTEAGYATPPTESDSGITWKQVAMNRLELIEKQTGMLTLYRQLVLAWSKTDPDTPADVYILLDTRTKKLFEEDEQLRAEIAARIEGSFSISDRLYSAWNAGREGRPLASALLPPA